MNKISVNPGRKLSVLGLVLSLGALPLLLGVTGCASGSHYGQHSGERPSDQDTSARVRVALASDTQYKYGGVGVQTSRGTVELTGFVNSRDQKNRASDLARNVSGVREIANYITVQESVN